MFRVLCLGNELLADDALGFAVAERIKRTFPQIDVVATTGTGFHLIDNLTDIDRLLVVDSIQKGNVPPGTLYVLQSSDIKSGYGPSPHYIGLLEPSSWPGNCSSMCRRTSSSWRLRQQSV